MKKIFAFVLIFAILLSSCAKEEPEIIEENDIIEESVSSESEVSEEIEEEDEKETYYDEVLEIPENPVKNEENKALSESFEFSGATKEISVITAAHYDKTINLVIPEDAVLEGEDYYLKAVFFDGSELSAGWIFIHKLEETTRYDDTLYYYRNPEKSIGYITHEKAVCGEYECVRIICHNGVAATDKESLEVPEDEKMYLYEYFFEINESEVLYVSFYAKGKYNTEAMKLQEKIIANLSVKDFESYIKIENGELSGEIHPEIMSSENNEVTVSEDEFVHFSMSIPEGLKAKLIENEKNSGIIFTMPWDERYENYFSVHKDDGTVYDYFYDLYSWGLKINEHTFNEINGNFSKGVYIRVDAPAKNIGDMENWVRSSTWFYVLQFDGYVVILHQSVLLDENDVPYAEHEKACNDFAASIKIG